MQNPTFMELLVQRKIVDTPVFTVDFNPKRPGSAPEIEFGVITYEKASGTLAQAPVNQKSGWWTVDEISFTVNGDLIKAANGSVIQSSMIFGSCQSNLCSGNLWLTGDRWV